MSNRAWVTLATNDSYGLGALVLAHSLRRVHTIHPTVVLITPSVTDAMRERLRAAFAQVVTVDVLDSRDAAHLSLLQRPELGITFTKIHCWELQYEKCVFLDADTLVVQNCDELFEREELSAAPDVGWPDCFNSGVFVFKPSQETFYELIKFAEEQGSFDGGDQGLLNSFFSDWARGDINKHLPFLYNVTSAAFYSYLPALKHYGQDLKIIHFIGNTKPWLQKFDWESRSVDAPEHLKAFLQLWWDLFVGQVHSHLDVAMVEVQEAPPALPPHDFSQHYMPVLDPDSEFPWHHPDAQSQEDRPLEIDMSQFHDPWEMYRGNIPPNRDDFPKRHSLSGRVEDHEEMKKYAWEYQKNNYVPYVQEPITYQQTHNQQHNYNNNNHLETQSNTDHSWESRFQHNWESHFHNSHGHDNSHNNQHNLQEHWHHGEHSSQVHDQHHQHHHVHDSVQNQYEKRNENIVFEQKPYHHDHHVHDHPPHCQPSIQHGHFHNSDITNQNVLDINLVQYANIDNIPLLTNEVPRVSSYEALNHTNHNGDHNGFCSEKRAQINGDVSDTECDDLVPRHPYDGFYLRHRTVINSHGRKICTHEIPETPVPSPPPETEEEPIFLYAEELFVANGNGHVDEDQSGVAGNLARVVPGSSGVQREALDELTRRQGWEAGNIDYLGADSFDNIWAKISNTLNQPRTSPPKQLTPPPKEPSPSKEPSSVNVAEEAAVVDAPVSEAAVVSTTSPTPIVAKAPAESEPVVSPAVVESAVESTVVAVAPVVEAPKAAVQTSQTPIEIPATVEVAAEVPASDIPATVEAVASTPVEAPAAPIPTQATAKPSEIPATVEASTPGEALAPIKVVSESPKVKPTEKTEPPVLPPPPASPESTLATAAKAAAAASPVPEPPITTPEKATKSAESSTDSPPLANTPSKDAPTALPDAKSEERRKGAGKLQLKPPAVADPLPTPDSEAEDAAALATSIIASELRTPTVTTPGSDGGAPTSPPAAKQFHRLSVDEPQVPTPPVDAAVSLSQIGVKPTAKPKATTAAQIESSLTEKVPEAASSDPPKKKIVKKVVKKESATGAEAPVPPPRKKEKKPKET